MDGLIARSLGEMEKVLGVIPATFVAAGISIEEALGWRMEHPQQSKVFLKAAPCIPLPPLARPPALRVLASAPLVLRPTQRCRSCPIAATKRNPISNEQLTLPSPDPSTYFFSLSRLSSVSLSHLGYRCL